MALGIVEVKSAGVQVRAGGELADARTSIVGYAADSMPPSRDNSHLARVLCRVYPLRTNQGEDRITGNGACIGQRTSRTYGWASIHLCDTVATTLSSYGAKARYNQRTPSNQFPNSESATWVVPTTLPLLTVKSTHGFASS